MFTRGEVIVMLLAAIFGAFVMGYHTHQFFKFFN